jgi:AraC-like DNA-binding protein
MEFPQTLKLLLSTYLKDGCPTVNMTAELAGTNVRTLQRNLAEFGLTYTELLHQVRMDKAMRLIKNNSLRIMDVAYEVGYEDPSNFARAFRVYTGLSPKEFSRYQNNHKNY